MGRRSQAETLKVATCALFTQFCPRLAGKAEKTFDARQAHAGPGSGNGSAFVYVAWPVAAEADSYSETVTDPSTEEVTKYSGRRDGDKIYVDAESKPVKPEAKPAKESNINEAIRCG